MLITEYSEEYVHDVYYSNGYDKGREQGIELGAKKTFVETCKEQGILFEETVDRYASKFNVSYDEAKVDVQKYWE